MGKTLVALYQDIAAAQELLKDLQDHDYYNVTMSKVMSQTADFYDHPQEISNVEGREFGALVGGFTGLMTGLMTMSIPSVGSLLAIGLWSSVIGGAAGAVIGAGAGAVAGGLSAALIRMSLLPDKTEHHPESALPNVFLLTVEVDDLTVDRALSIMLTYLPIIIGHGEERLINSVIESAPAVAANVEFGRAALFIPS